MSRWYRYCWENPVCRYIDEKVIEGDCLESYFPAVAKGARCLGSFLVLMVHIITAFLAFTSYFILLPYEQNYQSALLLFFYVIFGTYLMINVLYHYTKARRLEPIRISGQEGDRFCDVCRDWKAPSVHHCSFCQKCVLDMDHHCVWINQCVGAHNHRHFFLFITFLTFTMLLIIVAGYHSFWDHTFGYEVGRSFCSGGPLPFAPLQTELCSHGMLVRNCVTFAYLLAWVLFLMVGGLTMWNVSLISKGLTQIDYLKHSNGRAALPLRGSTARENWRIFLGLKRDRSVWRHILLPSGHPPVFRDDDGEMTSLHVI